MSLHSPQLDIRNEPILRAYRISCDGCGSYIAPDGTRIIGWKSPEEANGVARLASWLLVEEKHYCPKCHYYDEYGNIFIKQWTKIEGQHE